MTYIQACTKAQRMSTNGNQPVGVYYDPTDPDNDGLAYNLCWCATYVDSAIDFHLGLDPHKIFRDGKLID
jgi:hypothetical protein